MKINEQKPVIIAVDIHYMTLRIVHMRNFTSRYEEQCLDQALMQNLQHFSQKNLARKGLFRGIGR